MTAFVDGRRRRVCSATLDRAVAGTAVLRCRLSTVARKKLRQRPLKIRVRLAFFPPGGKRTVKVRSLTLRRA